MSTERPDFVMVGGQADGKFYLLASKTLTEVELRIEAERPDWFNRYDDRLYRPLERHFVTAEMRDYVLVVADSYAEAFRTLFDRWSPEPERPAIGDQRAIDAPARALPPG